MAIVDLAEQMGGSQSSKEVNAIESDTLTLSTMEEKAQLEADKVAAPEPVPLASAEIQALCPLLNFFVTVLLDALLLKFTECR